MNNYHRKTNSNILNPKNSNSNLILDTIKEKRYNTESNFIETKAELSTGDCSSHFEVLHKISEPQLKLNFIELIIKDIKIELNDNELIEEDQLFIEQILKTHIELFMSVKTL